MPKIVRRLARVLPRPLRRRLRAVAPSWVSPAPAAKPAPEHRKEPVSPAGLKEIARRGTAVGRVADTATLVSSARSSLKRGKVWTVVSAAEVLRRRESTEAVGSLLAAIAAFHRGYLESTWAYLREVPVELRSEHAMAEYVGSGIVVAPATLRDELSSLAASEAPQVDADGWFQACSKMFGAGESELARALFSRLDQAVDAALADSAEGQPGGDATGQPGRDATGQPGGDATGQIGGDATGAPTDTAAGLATPNKALERLRESRDWLRSWVVKDPDSPSAPQPADGHVSFAVMDYGHPGRSRASANIGDHVQSIASLGHLARRQGLRYHGADDVVALLERLSARVPEHLRVPVEPDGRQPAGTTVDVDLMTVDRDASMYSAIPPGTWTLAFGWFMHPIYEVRCGFPFHANLLPIFVSFHCSKRELLTEEAADYLKQYGPVGCRDWTTVDILLSMGIPAFFSGCLTTTVSTVYPPLEQAPGPDGPVAYVDMPADSVPDGAPRFAHSDDAIRFRSFARNCDDALELLDTYRRGFRAVVTSRLHAYLPLRSLWVDVDFQPRNPSDPRFEGLLGISDEQFESIRTGMLDKLDAVLTRVLAGEAAESVYRLWREITADDVAYARERHVAPGKVPPMDPNLPTVAAKCVDTAVQVPGTAATSGQRRDALLLDPVDVVVHLAEADPRQLGNTLGVLTASLRESAGRPVRITALSRLDPEQVRTASWSDVFSGLPGSVVSTSRLGSLQRPNEATPDEGDIDLDAALDLAVLPLLLPELSRVVVLPTAAVVLGDIDELASLPLGPRHLAAPTTRGRVGRSGFGLLHTAAGRLRDRTDDAAELRRIAHSRHAFDFDSLTTAVLVLDLEGLRQDGFVPQHVPILEGFGLDLRELLCLYAGPDRAEVPAAWDVVPTRDVVSDPRLVHWADALKPGHHRVVPGDQYWEAVVSSASPVG